MVDFKNLAFWRKSTPVLSPQQLEEQQTELEETAVLNYKKTLTSDVIREQLPELFYGMRLQWLKSFHIEDLEQPQEVSGFQAIFPYIQLGTTVLILLFLLLKK